MFLNLSINFFDVCQAFHKEAFIYAVKWFPLYDDLLKEAVSQQLGSKIMFS